VRRAPDDAHQLIEKQNEAESCQHLIQVVAFIESFEHQPFHEGGDQGGQNHSAKNGGGKTFRPGPERSAKIGAQHVKGAVGQVEHAHDAEDQGQAGGDDE